MRVASGTSLLLTGSGLYWILSSQLIASFSVLAPELLRSTALGTTLVLIVGIISSAAGLWIIHQDLDNLMELFNRGTGWLFTIPLLLAAADVFLTLFGLSIGSRIMELNPFVNSAVQLGTAALAPFILSYMALSEGVALLMLDVGRKLFPVSDAWKFLPYSAVCGAASVGPLSNMVLIANPDLGWPSYLLAAFGAVLLTVLVFRQLQRGRLVRRIESGSENNKKALGLRSPTN